MVQYCTLYTVVVQYTTVQYSTDLVTANIGPLQTVSVSTLVLTGRGVLVGLAGGLTVVLVSSLQAVGELSHHLQGVGGTC